jgi:cytochrome o ubiquinol oxidase subunit II
MKQKRIEEGRRNESRKEVVAIAVDCGPEFQIGKLRAAMRFNVPIAALICAAGFGGCNQGVLDLQESIAVAVRQVMFDSLGIMLAIVIPVILATLSVALWFRSSNTRASYRTDFVYSGRIEMLVWSIPLMTVLLVGGVAWVGAHELDPRKPISSEVKSVTVRVVSLDWKWLFMEYSS